MKRYTIHAVTLFVVLGITTMINAAPVVDGQFDPTEGYTSGHWVILDVEKAKAPVDDGQIWLYEDTNGDIYGNLILPVTLVDNTYGINSIGWGDDCATGKDHKFDDLKGSDGAEFRFWNGDGDVVLDFELDYISATSNATSGYASLGVEGGEGDVFVGSAEDILEWATSLDYNFNELGYVLTKDSPATDDDYTENALYPGWVFAVGYEFKIDGSVFGESGFGGIEMPLMHISPNKIGGNKVFDDVDGEVPEPATLSMLAFGSLALLRKRRG